MIKISAFFLIVFYVIHRKNIVSENLFKISDLFLLKINQIYNFLTFPTQKLNTVLIDSSHIKFQ